MTDISHVFPGQKTDEAVFVFARPYPIAFLPFIATFVLLYFFSLVGDYVFFTNLLNLTAYTANAGIVLLGVFQLLMISVFFVSLFDFYFDIIIVTDRRLVDIDQEQLFFRRTSELSLEDVEDVSSQQRGIFQTIFNYGQIEVQTAGARENFIIHNILYPRDVTSLILDLKDQAKRDVSATDRLPHTGVIGMIDNKPITTVNELEKRVGVDLDDRE